LTICENLWLSFRFPAFRFEFVNTLSFFAVGPVSGFHFLFPPWPANVRPSNNPLIHPFNNHTPFAGQRATLATVMFPGDNSAGRGILAL